MQTSKGDSGSPLIVQPKSIRGWCYLIGMHCAGKNGMKIDGENTALRITSTVKERLVKFEKELNNNDLSAVEVTSLNFDKVKMISDDLKD